MSRELRVGDELPCTECRVELWPMKVFSLLMDDPNPLHYDPAYVAGLGGGDDRPVNQGTLTVAYPLDALIAWLGGEDASARIVRFGARFGGSVRAGDIVVAGGRVSELQEDGTATVELWLDRRGDDGSDVARVLTATARVAPPSASGTISSTSV